MGMSLTRPRRGWLEISRGYGSAAEKIVPTFCVPRSGNEGIGVIPRPDRLEEPCKIELFSPFGSQFAVPFLQNISSFLMSIQLSRHELRLRLKTHRTTLTVQGINVISLIRVLRCPSRGPGRSDVPPDKIPRASTF